MKQKRPIYAISMISAFLLMATLPFTMPTGTTAQTPSVVTLSYDAVITGASGRYPGLFPAGERILVTYEIDSGVADSNADPGVGVFFNAVQSLSISFPGLGLNANAGPVGLAQTYDNFADPSGTSSDQVFFIGGPITSASTLNGEAISSVEVDFLSDFVVPPPQPSMLSSDELPLTNLPLTEAFVIITTNGQQTYVHFGSAPPPTPTPTPTPTPDSDGDGVPDTTDNCPTTPNPGQENNDGDALGDVCDPDDDNDGVLDGSDNCPLTPNSNQANNDGDAQGDVCDPDDDNDGVPDSVDNCPVTANPSQTDSDNDGIGDACDPVPNSVQNVVFSRIDGGAYRIFSMKPDGTNVARLTNSGFGDWEPVLSPNGTQVLFTRASLGADIYKMNIDGSGLTRVTGAGFGLDLNPAWSPDGTRIVFSSLRFATFGSWNNTEIVVMNADGSGIIRLTTNPATDTNPAWSPDGTKIAFVSSRFGNSEILVMNADGSGAPTRLTNNAALDRNPSWSPDGTKIAFETNRDGNFEIYSINADGSGSPMRLTNDAVTDTEPSWGANGRILFTSNRSNGNRIFVMNADGSGVTDLAQGISPDW